MANPIQDKLIKNKIVYLPPGVYTSDEQLIVPNGCQLFGASDQYTILEYPLGLVLGTGAEVHHFCLRGSSTSASGITATSENYVKVNNVKIVNYAVALWLNKCTAAIVRECQFRDNIRSHIRLTQCYQCRILCNDFTGSTLYCMHMQNPDFCHIHFNNFWQAGLAAFYDDPSGVCYREWNQYTVTKMPHVEWQPLVTTAGSQLSLTCGAVERGHLSAKHSIVFDNAVSATIPLVQVTDETMSDGRTDLRDVY